MSSAFNRIVVLSDLHIAPAPELGNFFAGRELAAFTAGLASEAKPGDALVLAGDVIDFLLLEDRKHSLHLATAARFTRETMNRLRAEEAWVPDWLQGLNTWIANGGNVVLLPGNHDLEWFHPDTDETWSDLLGGQAMKSFSVWRESAPWTARVGEWEVLIGHGHRGDPLNDCDPKVIHEALKAGEAETALPPGSEFVLETLHAFKRAMDPLTRKRRFPFIDALKPEPAVLALLMGLDRGLFFRHLPAAVGLKVTELRLQLLRRINRGPVLGFSDGEGGSLEEALASVIISGMEDHRLPASAEIDLAFEEWENSAPDRAPGTLSFDGGGDRLERWLLRGWLRSQAAAGKAFFDPSATSEFDRSIIEAMLPPMLDPEIKRVVVCGHSHACRSIQREGRPHHYLNTGTWSRLLDFSGKTDTNEDIDRLMQQALAGSLPFHQILSWVEITAGGPRLEQYRI